MKFRVLGLGRGWLWRTRARAHRQVRHEQVRARAYIPVRPDDPDLVWFVLGTLMSGKEG